jgi:hypothetical protein
MFQFPFPPPLDFQLDPPSTIEQLFACIFSTLLLFEMIVMILPERWQEQIGALQFGPQWAAKKKGRP